jgi:hypothetical protein
VKRFVLVSLPVVLALAVASAAFAKGGEHGIGLAAEITGPGLDEPIMLSGRNERGSSLAAQIAETAGFTPAAYGSFPRVLGVSADPILRTRPKGELGPRYTVTFVVPGPRGQASRVVQHVYPFAKLQAIPTIAPGQILTYMPPGQRLGGERTRGGWYVATSYLKDNLVASGVPASRPGRSGGSSLPSSAIAALAALVLVLGSAPILIRRRQARAATT